MDSGPKDCCLEAPALQERAVLQALVERGTQSRAAELLCLSPSTVNRHLHRMRERYGVRTTAQLAALAAARGWVTVRPPRVGGPQRKHRPDQANLGRFAPETIDRRADGTYKGANVHALLRPGAGS